VAFGEFGGAFLALWRQSNGHMLITCWSRDCFKYGHVFFQDLASEVLRFRNIDCNNKKKFLLFSANTNLFKKLIPEVYRGDSDLSHSRARTPFFSVVEEVSGERETASFAD
jgi:hypothetical protein